jgi:aliphatic nitrilase
MQMSPAAELLFLLQPQSSEIGDMMTTKDTYRIAAIQASPVFMVREATVGNACKIIAEVAGQGVRLAVFPETSIPG